MTQNYTVILAKTAQHSLQRQVNFLAGYVPTEKTEAAAYSRVEQVLDQITEILSQRPFIYPVAPELTEFGITRYRRMLIGTYRVFYEVDQETSTVTLILVIAQAQSVEQVLQNYAIIGHLP